MCQARDHAGFDRIGDAGKFDRNKSRLPLLSS
jgi:hypothetical protein